MTRRNYILCAVFLWAFISTSTVHATPLAGPVQAISCAPSDPRVATVLAENKIWTTSNGGESWVFRTDLTSFADDGNAREEPEDLFHETILDEEEEEFSVTPQAFLLDDTTDEEADHRSRAAVGLASSDNEGFAVVFPDSIAIHKPDNRGVIQLPVKGATDARFDPYGSLWILTPTRLLKAVGAAVETVATISGGGRFRRGATVFHLVATTVNHVMEIHSKTHEIVKRRFDSRVLDAWKNRNGALAVLHRGRVIWVDAEGEGSASTPVPGGTDALLVDRTETIYTRDKRGFWLADGEITQALALDLDASGRIWMGTPLTVVPPKARNKPLFDLQGKTSPRESFSLDPFSGPVPCPPYPINPLPVATIKGGLEKRRIRSGEADQISNQVSNLDSQESSHTRIYASISLTWTFGPPDKTKCVELKENHSKSQNKRRRILAALTVALTRALVQHRARPSWKTALEVERLRRLISVHSKEDKP